MKTLSDLKRYTDTTAVHRFEEPQEPLVGTMHGYSTVFAAVGIWLILISMLVSWFAHWMEGRKK